MRVAFHSIVLAAVVASLAGCGPKIEMGPVSGKVTYKGEPLKFGSVMLQPPAGQPARATIQPDGTFVMEMRDIGQGAPVGMNKVRVTCYESQAPGYVEEATDHEPTLGESLIPERYANYATSGLTVDVKPEGNENVLFELKD